MKMHSGCLFMQLNTLTVTTFVSCRLIGIHLWDNAIKGLRSFCIAMNYLCCDTDLFFKNRQTCLFCETTTGCYSNRVKWLCKVESQHLKLAILRARKSLWHILNEYVIHFQWPVKWDRGFFSVSLIFQKSMIKNPTK